MSILPVASAAALLTSGAPLKSASSTMAQTSGAFAKLLQKVVNNPTSNARETGEKTQSSNATVNGIDVEKLRQDNAAKIEKLARQLRAYLHEAGIDPLGGIDLQLDSVGQVRVAGNPFDKEKIEAVLASHPDLSRQFREIAANAGLLKAIDESVHCQNAGDDDPHSLVADSPQLFAPAEAGRFTLRVLPNAAETLFSNKAVG